MPVDAGPTEYNLIDRTDPDGGPACTILNLCFREINDAWWEFPVDANVGTGNLNPFWDTHNSPTSECFNTDASPLPLNCARSSWTNALPLNVVPVFFFDPPGADPPVLVRELVWDMNEPNSSPQTAQVSIDFFRVYLCAQQPAPPAPPPPLTVNPALFSTVAQVEANCDRVYDIEVGGISSGVEGTGLAWDGSTQGSGNSLDYRILLPESLFEAQANTASCPYDPAGPNCGLFVIVHAHLGGKGLNTAANVNWETTGGFEEMSTVERPVPARKSGIKFHDLNANGVQDAGEPGLAGFTIFVETINHNGVLDAGEPNDVTDATGAYQINAIIEGTWFVHELPPAGQTWICSFPATTDAHGCYYQEEFADGEVHEDNDFGNYQNGTKSGQKFEDENANGTKDAGDAGLSGWVIRAYGDLNGNDVLDAAEFVAGNLKASATTDASGNYSMTLAPGDYIVCEVAQATWTQSAPGGTDECTGGVPTLAPDGYAITITSGLNDTGNDFGNYQNGSKTGQKFEDENANGTKDAGDAGLSGWEIRVYGDLNGNDVLDAGEFVAGNLIATDNTDASGDYSFSLPPGDYIVCEVAQATWTQSAPGGTDECTGGVPTLAPDGWAITVTSGSTDTGNDFGNWRNGTKTGTKFNDLNSSGTLDAGETGLSGWEIRAYGDGNGNDVLDAGEFVAGNLKGTSTTDASGNYSISLAPGDYIVCEVAQVGWNQTAPANTVCQAGAPTLANGGWAITITSGDTDSGNHFGNVQPPADTETAYARGPGGATCFTDFNPPLASNWGWAITVTKGELPEEYQIWAGAAQCNTANGTLVGTLTVSINAQNKLVFTYDLLPGFTLESIHVYASLSGFPSSIAPGQFGFTSSPGTNDASIITITVGAGLPAGTTIYFIAHAVVSGLP